MNGTLLYENESFEIRGALYEVYKTLGNGFLEEVYQRAVETEFRLRNIDFVARPMLHATYKGVDCGVYIPDIICNNSIIIELKAVETLHDRHRAQVMNYLKATKLKLGFLVNFGSYPSVQITRIVL